MARAKLPRDIALRVNRIANMQAASREPGVEYRKTFKERKVRLLGRVVAWLAAGKTESDIVRRLHVIEEGSPAKLLATSRELAKAIWETP